MKNICEENMPNIRTHFTYVCTVFNKLLIIALANTTQLNLAQIWTKKRNKCIIKWNPTGEVII